MKLFSRADQSPLSTWWWTVDRKMLIGIFVLMAFGIVLVSTASPPVAENLNLNPYHFLIRHIIFLIPAVFIMIAVSLMNARQIWRISAVLFVLLAVAMVMVLLTGSEIKGAQRWIRVFGFSFQPSELVKPVFAVLAAKFMALEIEARQKGEKLFPGHIITAGLYALILVLLLLQPDLGMAFVVSLIWTIQIFLAGFPFALLLVLAALGLGGLVLAYFSFEHVQNRIDRFFDPASGDNYQIQKSLEAFKNGGIFGQGPGQGELKLHLPDSHADFIFSVAGEELGMIFTLIIAGLFLFILLRGFRHLNESNDIFIVLAVGGLLSMLGLQALIHMGSSLNLLPAKGMTLPFISYGGSSMFSVSFSMGVILSLTRRAAKSTVSRAGLSAFSLNRAYLHKLKGLP